MRPQRFGAERIRGLTVGSVAALLASADALAATTGIQIASAAIPAAIAVGAGGFAAIAAWLMRRWKRQSRITYTRMQLELAAMRARLDDYETLLAGIPEMTVLWADASQPPRLLGQPGALLPPGRTASAVLKFADWLAPADAEQLGRATTALRHQGALFDLTLTSREGAAIRASGRVLGGNAVLRLRPAAAGADATAVTDLGADASTDGQPTLASVAHLLELFRAPAFLRDSAGRLRHCNSAYRQMARKVGRGNGKGLVDLFTKAQIKAQLLAATQPTGDDRVLTDAFPEAGSLDLVTFALSDGMGGLLRSAGTEAAVLGSGVGHITPVINALPTPVAIYDGGQRLLHANRAFAQLWNLPEDWLATGPLEAAVLDRLRTAGRLPAEPDYRGWRDAHLQSYGLAKPRQTRWHLPSGQTLNVTAAPATTAGGVIYIYDDQTEHLQLVSRNKALTSVQRETLNALNEGVAVFGTNGRLTLHNPRFAWMWQIAPADLSDSPHVDRIATAAGAARPEDGAAIWSDLKSAVVDLDPARGDRTGRFARADKRLYDYAVTRLPDGQTMMTFADVTESANYERVLQERNEALVAADWLKNAFVQNVSYELRSPLTNIIGFAELLASGEAGPLTDRQRDYTGFIRTSSATLGVLIDSILDLTTIDAGVAELHPEPVDVVELVEKARVGLDASAAGAAPPVLKIDIADTIPEFVADPTRMVQVLYNLLANAARFAGSEGTVWLTVSARPERVVFAIEDDGATLSDEERAALAEAGSGPNAHSAQRGAGLSVTIARAFANMHGGTLTIEPRQPRGTRMILNMPAVAMTAADAAE